MLKPIHLLAVLFVAAALLYVTGQPLLEAPAALREQTAAIVADAVTEARVNAPQITYDVR